MEAATAMDFHTLSRRELQALCKRNGVRANMTNVAMAEALQGLTSVDGIDEIGTTLCLPTPGRSAMKSAAKMVAVEEQHGSPLPRGRRVSVKSPEAIRMEVEGGEDGMKEIVKTPGVALRSTRRSTRATPAPLPTPVPACSTRTTTRRTAARKTGEVVPTPATRRSQRTSSRKVAGAVEADRPAEDGSGEKASKMTIALDQEAEVLAAASKEEKVHQDEPKAAVSDVQCDHPNDEEKVQQEEPKVVASDVKFDGPKEEEVAKFLEGDYKEEELEEGEEADSSDATTGSAAVSFNDPKVVEVVVVMEEQSTKPHEGTVKELEPISVERSTLLTVTDDSPILGVIEKEQDASVEDCEDLAEFSPAREMTDEIIPVTGDMEVAISEDAVTEDKLVAFSEVAVTEEVAIKEDGFANTVETDPTPEEILLTAAGEDETIEEGEVILTEGKEGAADEMPQAGETSEEDEDDYLTELKEGAADEVLQAELGDNETSEEDEDDLSEQREGAAAKMLQGELTDDETSEEDDLDEDEEWASDDDENTGEIGLTDESDEDSDETNEESYTTCAVQMLQGTGVAEEANEDASTEGKEGAADEMPQAGETSEEDEEDYLTELKERSADEVLQAELGHNETSEEDEDDLSEQREGAAAKMLQGELTDDETSEEEDLDEDEEWASDDDENTEEIGSTDESDEDSGETNEESYTTGAVQMLQVTGVAEEANEDASAEDDDFSGDLPPEFDNIMIFSDAETESDIAPVLEENQAAVASATKTAKSLDDSAMNAEQDGPEEADATEKAMKEVDNIVNSLVEFTFKEGESEEMQKQHYHNMSLRKLKTTYKNFLIAANERKQEEVTEGKRLPLEELDENSCIDH